MTTSDIPRSSESNNQCIDLNEFNASDFINFIHYLYYKTDIDSNVELSFTGDADFRVVVFAGWIFITVENEQLRLVKFLGSYTRSMTYYSSKATVYAFYGEKKPLKVSDFKIIRELWKFQKDIKRIEIGSHNITFRRFSPSRLQNLCLCVIDENSVTNLPKNVLKRLGFFLEQGLTD